MIGLGIMAVIMAVPITAIIAEHKQKMLKVKAGMVKEEIELEKLKQQNYIIETEKMKLELEQMKLDYTSGKNDLMKL
ncbi:hypothetical protein H9649_07685 [Sporosarcina sp. Sa2YVA2]|uniref:Uncharacterized protein n=1 Tax=Sporosarcina quadrami TaxID=2762234 RepID=A0ABR8U8U8_9BACL|nr:hypothetical protein [Sporosarcina quadrami]MBD7984456.1 hypothetical protein [Sporosarcina quadrami]